MYINNVYIKNALFLPFSPHVCEKKTIFVAKKY